MPFRIALGLVDDDFLNFTGKVVPNRSSLASEAQDRGFEVFESEWDETTEEFLSQFLLRKQSDRTILKDVGSFIGVFSIGKSRLRPVCPHSVRDK